MKIETIKEFNIHITEEERVDLLKSIKAVNDGEGAIDDYQLLKKFYTVLEDLGAI